MRARVGLLVVAVTLAGGSPGPATARGGRHAPRDLANVAVSELPAEARLVLGLIERGGPFAYRKDGAVFGNRERRLPPRPRGYYHEYTVPTPGARDRGARRIIAGEAGERYWTADHYRTFRLIEGTP